MRSLKKYIATHRRSLGLVGTIVALAVATLYFIVVPEKTLATSGIVKLLLLYGHGVCWLLIAAASGIWAVKGANRWSNGLLYVALAIYIAFLASMVMAPANKTDTINSFQVCKNAGGTVAESYPEQCFLDGKSFVNDVQRTGGTDGYVGLSEQQAMDKAKSESVAHRVVERNGEPLFVTMDYLPGRLNFYVKDGTVYKVQVEGEE